ncbi:MAG: RdgB/HAM1 family non-canonical purine NTP pyrophosphatase [Clostridia bacterium]|nr:RdgB/HAM1 family non-canonical purine NTP pyrophosphatase [Clostridia bacterium]
MKEIVIATNNQGKLKELKEILAEYELLTLNDVNCKIEVEEDQETFEGNSKKKAKEISKVTGKPAIADDSGLCIEAFQGWPGVYTARFLGEKASQEERNQAILEKMKNLKGKQRKAKVVCVITYCENGKCILAKGEIEGKIAIEPRGENGFGFDSIFELDNGKTYAQLSEREKNTMSHRKRAIENLKKQLTSQ